MESHQAIQNRAGQTAAVIAETLPTLTIGGVTAAMLLADSLALEALARTRDGELAAADAATNAEHQGYLSIQTLVLALPRSAEGELDEDAPAESALLDLLDPAYGITPRTTEAAIERGQKVVSALTRIDAYLAGRTPARAPITSGGKGLAALTALLAAQPPLEQAVEDSAAAVSAARVALRTAARAVDRLNKRFYSRLRAEARTNSAVAEALGQIVTESGDLPGTLGIRSIVQGGAENLLLLVSYENGSYDATATNTLEWTVAGAGAEFPPGVPVDPSGNALGPFTIGKVVRLRTRVSNANGTTTGSIRTLTILPPA